MAGSCTRPNRRASTAEHPAEARSARRLSGSPPSPSGSAFHGVYSVRKSSAYLPLCAGLDVGHTPVRPASPRLGRPGSVVVQRGVGRSGYVERQLRCSTGGHCSRSRWGHHRPEEVLITTSTQSRSMTYSTRKSATTSRMISGNRSATAWFIRSPASFSGTGDEKAVSRASALGHCA